MTDDLEVAIRCARAVALLHPTLTRRAPIGMYYVYEDRHLRLRVSDQVGLDDFGVWAPAVGGDWKTMLLWSPYAAEPERPLVFLPGGWIAYLRLCRRAGAGRGWIGGPHTGTPARHGSANGGTTQRCLQCESHAVGLSRGGGGGETWQPSPLVPTR